MTVTRAEDHGFMARALRLARRGLYTTDPNPRVGCVIVRDEAVVGEGWHERAGEPHAEIHALREAGEAARGATVYVTLEPCAMCVGALVHARVKRVVYGAREYKTGAIESAGQLFEQMNFNHRIEIEGGLLEDEAAGLLSDFFARRRLQKKRTRNQTGEPES